MCSSLGDISFGETMRFPITALSPEHESPPDIFRHIAELRVLWLSADRYSQSDMLLIRRIISKQLTAQLHALKAYTDNPSCLPGAITDDEPWPACTLLNYEQRGWYTPLARLQEMAKLALIEPRSRKP